MIERMSLTNMRVLPPIGTLKVCWGQ